jgi:hypothetical protein
MMIEMTMAMGRLMKKLAMAATSAATAASR